MKMKVESEIYEDYKRILKVSNQQPCYNDEEMKDLIKYYTHIHIAKILFVSFLCMLVSFLIIFCIGSQTAEMVYSSIVSFVITMFLVFMLNKYDTLLDLRCYLYSDTDVSNPEKISYEMFYSESDFILAALIYGGLSFFLFITLTCSLFINYKKIFECIKLLKEFNGFVLIIISIWLVGMIVFMFIHHFYKRKIHRISKRGGVGR